MDRRRKLLLAVALITVVAVSAVLVWLTEANIRYAFNVDYSYQKDGGRWVTVDSINDKQMNGTFVNIECKNHGYFEGSFNLIVTFTNAMFSTTTAKPYEQVNGTTAKFSYKLLAGESRDTDVYFTIDDNATGFLISLWFESSQIFLRSSEGNWLGVNTLYYEYINETNRFEAILIA
jgi:hypothetical protein